MLKIYLNVVVIKKIIWNRHAQTVTIYLGNYIHNHKYILNIKKY